VRTVAEAATDAELAADIEYLITLWKQIGQAAQTAPPQALLYQDLSLATRVLRDLVTGTTERIIVDSRETFGKMQDFASRYTRGALPILEHYSGERPLFDLFPVEDEIEKALARRVDLKSGGYVIIDQTEALTTVDVNTGGFVSGRSFDDTIFKTNLEATQAIARQLRLRNLGGIIIVDFIDMESVEHRDAVLAEFKKALARDRTRVTVNGFSQLGLVEMTRKRTRESLAHILCEPCPVCVGRGELKAPQTVCYDILREVLRADRQFNAKEYRILAAQKVIDLLPRGGICEPHGPGRLHRQAHLDAGRERVHAGAVRRDPRLIVAPDAAAAALVRGPIGSRAIVAGATPGMTITCPAI
jgi:ribonuclease G